MTTSIRSAAALILLANIVATAVAAADKPPEAKPAAMDGMDMTSASAGAETPADHAYAKANAAMMKDMQAKPSGDADHDFVTMMLPHHQGAVDMAKVELQYGKDPTLRTMATGVIKAQEAEIAEMQAWRKTHPR